MQLFPYSQEAATAGSSTWHGRVFTLVALPDATPEGFVAPSRTEAEFFHLLGEHGNHYSMELCLYSSAYKYTFCGDTHD